MNIRDILVVIDDQREGAAQCRAAFQVASRFDAAVRGLYVALLPEIPGYVEAQLPEALKEQRRTDIEAAAAAARTVFDRCAEEAGTETEWHQAVGTLPDIVGRVTGHVRFADLTVMGRDWGRSAWPSFADEIVLSSGTPVLLLPGGATTGSIGQRVLVGWNGSREATRALHDSIAFLQIADEVTLLTVQTETVEPGETDGMVAHLAHHGIDANFRRAHVSGHEIGEVILSRASEIRADLIVMGAYGHSRMSEIALGGATRHVLRESDIAVLMSH